MKKEKIELDIEAYLKALNKKPSVSVRIISTLLAIWVFAFIIISFAVITKLMVEAVKWIL